MKPPKDRCMTVRCLKDAGEVILSYGRATMVRGSTVSLPVDEAEPLVREGVVEPIDWDEWGYGKNEQ